VATAVVPATGVLPAAGAAHAPRDRIRAGYSCTSPVGSLTVPVTLTGSLPRAVATRATVSLADFEMSVTVPASAVDELVSLGVTAVSGAVTTFDVTATDATPATTNLASGSVAVGPIDLVAGKPVTVVVPASPTTVGHWTAGAKGHMTLTDGPLDLILSVPGLGSLSASCTPTHPMVLGITLVW
jgi:hypothetical protein